MFNRHKLSKGSSTKLSFRLKSGKRVTFDLAGWRLNADATEETIKGVVKRVTRDFKVTNLHREFVEADYVDMTEALTRHFRQVMEGAKQDDDPKEFHY